MKKLLLTLALFLAPATASAQCSGIFNAGNVCGSIAGGPPGQVPGGAVANAPYLDLRNFAVPPKTFSTVCNGSGDDTATILAATNAANTNNGGIIVAPAGSCQIATINGTDLTNKSNIVYQGQGNGANLNAGVTKFVYTPATGLMFKLDGAIGITFRGIAFQYTNASYNGDLFDLRQVSGVSNTNLISFIDDYFAGINSSTANSFIRLGGSGSLSIRIERSIFSNGATAILGGANANNVYIGNNFFYQSFGTQHIGVQGEGWTLLNNTFEPTDHSVGCKNIKAVGTTNGLFMAGNTFNDCPAGTSDTLVDLSAFAINGQTFTGNIVQGGNTQYNAGSGTGVLISGNSFNSNSTSNVVVNSASNVVATGNSNTGQLIGPINTSSSYIIDTITGGLFLSQLNLGGSTQHGVLIGGGTNSSIVSSAVMSNGQLLVGQSAADPLPKTITGCALTAAGAFSCPVSAITGLGTNVATALGNTLNASGGLVGFSGNIGAATGTSLKLGGSAMTAVLDIDQAGGDVFSYRFNSSNPRFDFAIGGGSGMPAFGVNFVWSGSGNVFNFDRTGGAFLIGNLVGATSPFLLCANTGTAGAATGFDATTNCGFTMTVGGIPVIGISAPTGNRGELGIDKIAASGSAPGAASAKLSVVAGTNAGTCKLIMYAGTSSTPITVIDNVGSGC